MSDLEERVDEYADELEGKVVKEESILKKIKEKIWNGVFYGNGWDMINGGFADVEEMDVVQTKDKNYHVWACVKHGEQDMGDGHSVTYSDQLEFVLNEKFEVVE